MRNLSACSTNAIATGAKGTMGKALEWLAWDQDPRTRAQVQSLVDAQDMQHLSELLDSRLEFGGSAPSRAQTDPVDACA